MTEEQIAKTDVLISVEDSNKPSNAEGVTPADENDTAIAGGNSNDNNKQDQLVPKRHRFTSSIVVLLVMIASAIALLVLELSRYVQYYIDNADTTAGFDLLQFSAYQRVDLAVISFFLLLLIVAAAITVIGTRCSSKPPSPTWRVVMSVLMLFPMGYVINMIFEKCACLAPSTYHVPLGMPEFMRFGSTVLGIAAIVALVFIILIIIVFRDAMRCANVGKKKYNRATLVSALVLLVIGVAMIAFFATANLDCIYALLSIVRNSNPVTSLLFPIQPAEMNFPNFLHELTSEFIKIFTTPIHADITRSAAEYYENLFSSASNLASNVNLS